MKEMTWDQFLNEATVDERIEVAKTMSPENLLTAFCCTHFDPFDYKKAGAYEVLKAEILNRLNRGMAAEYLLKEKDNENARLKTK